MKPLMIILCLITFAFSARANVVGNGLQNFNTITNGLDFVTIHGSETLKPGIINLGLFFNEAVNSLPYLEGGAQGRTTFNDTILGMDMNLGIGLGPNWDAGISVPFVLHQTVGSDSGTHGEFFKTGNTEIRINTKYRLLGDDSGGLAVIGSVNFDRTTNNPYIGSGAGPIFNLETAWDTTIAKWAVGVNLGYRKTQPGSAVAGSFFDPVGDQIIFGAATSYLLPSLDTKLIFEVFGSAPAERRSSNPDRNASSLEFLGGIKHDLTGNLALHGGTGTELIHGVSSPDWRMYAGINYVFGPVWGSTPEPLAAVTDERFVTRSVLFDFDSDRMTGDYQGVLAEIAARLKKVHFKKITVIGYTDSIGPSEYNRQLSQKRANVIRRHLIDQEGIPGDSISAEGRGETEPLADNGNFQGRQENRRVEFLIAK